MFGIIMLVLTSLTRRLRQSRLIVVAGTPSSSVVSWCRYYAPLSMLLFLMMTYFLPGIGLRTAYLQ